MKFQTYDLLPEERETQYLRDQKVNFDNINGIFLMTPFLRYWQRQHMYKYIPNNSTLLDIGIGTGRSKDLWKMKNNKVYGVEPNLDSVEILKKKCPNVEIQPWSGDNPKIREWATNIDVVMMIYSITFFFKNHDSFTKLIDNITIGKKIVIIGMDGDIVDGWTETDNSIFEIKKKYKKRSTFGNEIEISMKNPFTLVTNQTEYLTDFNHLRKVLSAKSFKCIHDEHVEPPNYLNDDAKKFVSAQRLLVFEKTP